MKQKQITFLVSAIILSIFLILQSCNDGNDPALAEAEISFKAVTTSSTISGGRTQTTGLEFTTFNLGVTELEFETVEENESEDEGEFDDEDGDGEDDDEEIEFEGNFIVDLIAGTSNPDFGIAQLAPGLYEEIEIEMEPILSGNNSVYVEFNYTPDGAETPVYIEFSSSEDFEFEIENEQGLSLTEGSVSSFLVLFDLDAIFSNIDLSSAEPDEDNVIRINENSNSDLHDDLIDGLEDGIECGEDDDDDGEIDD